MSGRCFRPAWLSRSQDRVRDPLLHAGLTRHAYRILFALILCEYTAGSTKYQAPKWYGAKMVLTNRRLVRSIV